MSTKHSKAAGVFLKNIEKSKWHDATFWAVRTKRDVQAQSLDEWEQLREMASNIKKHTITHMDEYLEKFATNAEKNGIIVFKIDVYNQNGVLVLSDVTESVVKRRRV